jgi:DNA (cytosine-5)-methyltransferase 1
MQSIRLLDLFSGIGGFSYAAEHLVGGFSTVQFVEQNPYCQRVLAKHWPGVPIHDDICTFNPAPGSADVICGGFPCQDISTAGKQAGIKEGTRSGLFYELMRVVRLVVPQYVVLENVAAITSNGLDIVLGTLAEAGFDAEWACIPAADVGACHRRDRWWCVAYPSHLFSHGSQAGHCGEFRRPAVSEPGDGGGAGDAANPHHQRQQERQPAAITGGSGWPCWGDAPRRLNPDWRSYLSQPVVCRGDDGLSGRVDRLRALGNAVVPQVAAIPLQRVKALAQATWLNEAWLPLDA